MEIVDSVQGMWRLTCFYGYQEGSRRCDSWNLLHRLANESSLPCCIIGDFNDILSFNEKRGKADIPNLLINGFREALTNRSEHRSGSGGFGPKMVKAYETECSKIEPKFDRE
jgi:hypothetical protein